MVRDGRKEKSSGRRGRRRPRDRLLRLVGAAQRAAGSTAWISTAAAGRGGPQLATTGEGGPRLVDCGGGGDGSSAPRCGGDSLAMGPWLVGTNFGAMVGDRQLWMVTFQLRNYSHLFWILGILHG